MTTMNPCRIAAMAALACLMAACGGKSGGSASPPPPPPATFVVSIQNSGLRTEGDAATGVNVAASDPISIVQKSGDAESLFIRWSYTGKGISFAQLNGSTYDALSFDIDYVEPDMLPDGEYDDAIQLEVAEDETFTRPIAGSPFRITSTYVVHGSAAHVVPAILGAPRTHLAHDVLDAAMSPSLHAIAMTSAAPDDALYLYDIGTGTEKKLALAKPATALGMSPDGRSVAIGHDAMVTWVDLTTLGQATPDVKELAVPTIAWNIVADGQGAIHVFPARDQWVNLYSIDIASAAVQSYGLVYEDTRAKLHPAGDRVYAVDTALSPENMERYGVDAGMLTHDGTMPYWGDWSICGDFWFAQAGDRIYTACGNTFAATADHATDMVYAGALSLSAPADGGYYPAITSLSDSAVDGRVVLFDAGRCGMQGGPDCDTLLREDETVYAAIASYRMPPVSVDGVSATRLHGAHVFHAADGTVFTLSRAVGADPAQAWFLDTPFENTNTQATAMARGPHASGVVSGMRRVGRTR